VSKRKRNNKPTAPAEVVRCPKCNRPQPKRGSHDTIYWCEHCRCQFDDEPDEGGTYDDRNPARRLEREEWIKEKRP
jgi:ribosomal protein L37AE/L43A